MRLLAVSPKAPPRRVLQIVLVLALLLPANGSLGARGTKAQGPSPITYVYDDGGRLVAVVDPVADTGLYSYDAAGNITSVGRRASSTVSIIEFSPKSGPVGTTVTIYGSGFSSTAGQNTVTFGGTAATVSSATATQLVAAVPAGAPTGAIAVTAPGGSATSTASFSVTTAASAPMISGFTPSVGAVDSVVTVNGANFEPTAAYDKVTFAGLHAIVDSATATTISARVPPGLRAGRVTVATPAGVATSSADFFVPPSPYGPVDVTSTGRVSVGGSALTATVSPANKVGLVIFDGTEGQQLGLGLTGVTIGSGTGTVADIYIYSPDATTLASKLLTTSGGDINLPPLPVTGTYTILVDPTGTFTGSVTLTLSEDIASTIAIDGASVAWTISRQGQNARATFTGAAGDRLGLGVSGVTIGSNTFDTLTVYVYNPDGTTLASRYLGTAGGDMNLPSLPAAGTYTILLDPRTNTGNATLTLSRDVVGSITIDGSALTVTVNRVGQNGRVTFEGTAGQLLGLGMTNVTMGTPTNPARVTVNKPDGTQLHADNVGASGSDFNLPVLPISGLYTIFIDPKLTTGSMTLTLSLDLSGSITIDGASVTTTVSRLGQNARITFPGTAGQNLGLAATNLSAGMGGTKVYVNKPDGVYLDFFTAFAAGSDRNVPVLPVTGTYTLLVDPELRTGSLTLTLSQDVAGSITVDGAAVTTTVSRVGQNARISFQGTGGQNFGLGITDATMATSCFSPVLRVYRPDDSILVTGWGGTDSRSLSFSAATTGTYAIVVDPALATGSITLTLSQDVAGPIAVDGASVVATASRAGQNSRLTFSGTSGQLLGLGVTGVSTAGSACEITTVKVLKPDGSALNTVLVGTNGTASNLAALPSSGTYTILTSFGGRTGSLTLTLSQDIAGAITVGGAPVTSTISRSGQNARYTFSGTSGQQLNLAITGNTMSGDCCLSLIVSMLRPNGTTLGSVTVTGSTASLARTLDATGTHTVSVEPYLNTGSMTLTLTQVGGALEPVFADVDSAPTGFAGAPGPHGLDALRTPAEALAQDRAVPPLTQGSFYFVLDGAAAGFAETPPPDLLVDLPAAIGPIALLAAADDTEDEEWVPGPGNLRGNWRTGRADSPWQVQASLEAATGVTALTGHVLRLNGHPLAEVTVRVGEATARTDATGRFLLEPVSPGRQVLVLDGRTANRPGRTYGMFETTIEVRSGQTNILPFTIWMPRVDTAHATTISSPTTAEVVATTPRIRDLEVHIPPGTVIRDRDGNIVREVSITPLPTDRVPFPGPRGVEFPVLFTMQPGTSVVEGPGIRLVFPNTAGWLPGERIDFWRPSLTQGWYVYGHGTVSADGRQVVPDPGVVIDRLMCAAIGKPALDPSTWAPPGGGVESGDPVDLASGLLVVQQTDLALPDALPISLGRTYRQNDLTSRAFGIGTNSGYELHLIGDKLTYAWADLVLPDGGRIHYVRTSPGASYLGAVMEHTGTPTAFHESVLSYNFPRGGWDLELLDGTLYRFAVDFAPEIVTLQAVIDRNGNQLTISRSGHLMTMVSSPNGRWISFTYDGSQRISQARDNLGRTVTYTYDASGRLWKVTDVMGGVTEYAYDASHRMTTIKDARGIVYLTNEYDAGGRVSRQTQADGSVYQFAYTVDGGGKITQTDVTDPRGTVRRVTFNGSGYALTDTYAVGQPEQQTWTSERQAGTNLVTAVIDPLNRRTSYVYDGNANLTSVTELAGTPDAATASFTYTSAFNQLASATDPLGRTTSLGYDAKGNLTGVTDPLGHATTIAYNAAGQPTAITGALGNTTQLAYQLGDLVSATDPLGRQGTVWVDSGGRTIRSRDPLGNTARTDYNAFNLPTQVTDPLGNAASFTYDANANLLSVTDPRNNVTSYSYNSMDRLATRTDPLTRVETYTHDLNGNLASVLDRKSQTTGFTYDRLDRPTRATHADGATTDYSYDAASRLTQAVDSAAGTITLAYDTRDRLTAETTPQGSVSYAYDLASRRTGLTVGGQPQVTYAHDNGDRLTSVTQGGSTASYAYDNADRLTSLTLPNSLRQEYGYDAASQLTAIAYKQGASTIGDLAYGYDSAGRRSTLGGSFARTGIPTAVASAAYDAANRLTSWGGATLAYDNNGNLTGDGTSAYTWNARDQLASIGGPTAASFTYDGFGRRISRTVGGSTTSFLHDGVNPVQELSGGTPVANLVTGLGIDEVLSRTDSAGARSLLTDALGSTIALTDSAGAIQTQYTYEPFGKTTTSGPSSTSPYQYTGRENDGTGLYFYRARYYSPTLQRFISEDPIEFEGGDSNLYAYVWNSPTEVTDPSGEAVPVLVAICARGALGGAGGAGAGELFNRHFNPDFGGRKVDWGNIVKGAVLGCVTGGLGAATSSFLSRGQLHHAVSKGIFRELEKHPILRGHYKNRDPRFASRAILPGAHRGWQDWHRKLDREIADWVSTHPAATPADFERYLRSVYHRITLRIRFPYGL